MKILLTALALAATLTAAAADTNVTVQPNATDWTALTTTASVDITNSTRFNIEGCKKVSFNLIGTTTTHTYLNAQNKIQFEDDNSWLAIDLAEGLKVGDQITITLVDATKPVRITDATGNTLYTPGRLAACSVPYRGRH